MVEVRKLRKRVVSRLEMKIMLVVLRLADGEKVW